MILTKENNKAMKTNIYTITLITFITLFSFQLSANSFQFEDESYIDDIPFDTGVVYNKIMNENVEFEEEAYIDDIPFNTYSVSVNHRYVAALKLNFEFSEEEYIDDIPFNTKKLAKANTSESTGYSYRFLIPNKINYLF